MFVEKPHAAVPKAAKRTAVWLAPRRPSTLHNRPYSGVKVLVASKYLSEAQSREYSTFIRTYEISPYAVPSQLAC